MFTDTFDTILSWYQDPLFILFPVVTFALGIASFIIYATPWTLLAWYDPEWAKPYRVQNKDFNVAKFLPKNIYLIALNSSVAFSILVLSWPLLRLSGIHDGDTPTVLTFVWQLCFFILLDDFLFYWLHRLMHENKWLLKHVHSVHHQVRTPYGLAGNYFHWAELSLTAGVALIGPLLLSSHIYVVYAWFIWRQLEAVDGHTGYNFWWNPMRLVPFYHGPEFHDQHHETYKGNYAGFFPVLDRWLGTQSKVKRQTTGQTTN